ncbi:SAM-dependent methyltransferase [Cyclobacterium salsum]|uniref:SAM-dependent methyltransferase n=1 Tax=Cyclobacterium salsum TaxID=2666329 RepID=UPI001391F404|nr:class I SAM-dependent methyltransferase [Cyclobacterium salsum]
MASKQDIDYTYSKMDKIWRWSVGETADFTGAKYDGDFSLSLEAAQRNKHTFIAENLEIKAGDRVLDIGSGWGPFLTYIKELGAIGTGITLSEGQYNACKRNGLDVHICNYRDLSPATFGKFDAIASVGAFEHFCSVDEYRAGKQDEVYQNFFKIVSSLLPVGKRCFIQSMVFDKGMIAIDSADIHAPKDSNEYLLALIMNEFPGSWIPYGKEQIIKNAAPYFKLVTEHSGRLDYIETIKVWRQKLKSFGWKKYWAYLQLVPQLFTDPSMRKRLSNLKVAPIKVAFEREIWDHHRLVFEKVSD